MPQIVSIIDNAHLANEVITGLLSAGLSKDNISLIMSDKARANFSAATKDKGDRAVVDTAIGAASGGAMGALLAGLTTAGAVLIPGMQLLVVGPAIAILTGIGAGAALGGIAGVLSALGISTAESLKYSAEIKAGKAVIVAHTKDEEQTQKARAVFMSQGTEIRAA